ncbi:MAG: sugar ABC transporter permease [Gammaproteobacteria bacterium]|nr:sugar ABC transporter permease [Gammaproteobacteria bacterium]
MRIRPAKFLDSRRLALLLFLPFPIILFTFMVVFPIVEAVRFSFYNWNGFGSLTDFVGIENYEDVLSHRHFSTALKNTGLVVGVSLLIQLPLALWASLVLIEKSWSINLLRALFFLPFMLAEVATGLIWRFVYDAESGFVHSMAELFSLDMPHVLGDKLWAMPAILLVVVWKYFGFHMMIYIAALQSISKDIVEAAQLDGASPWRIHWFIRIPMIKSAIVITVFFAVIGAMQLFDLVYSLTGGGPSHSSHTLVSFLYQFGITRMKLGFGSAVSVMLFFACVAITLWYQHRLSTTQQYNDNGVGRGADE